jgi:hypothetical protein
VHAATPAVLACPESSILHKDTPHGRLGSAASGEDAGSGLSGIAARRQNKGLALECLDCHLQTGEGQDLPASTACLQAAPR